MWDWLPVDLLEDLQDYLIAKQFRLSPRLQPWEAGDIPCYWIARCSLFDEVIRRIRAKKGEGDADIEEAFEEYDNS